MQPFIPTVDARIHFDFPDSLAAKTREYQQNVAQDIAAGAGLQRRNSLDLSFGAGGVRERDWDMDASVDKENPNSMMGGGYNSPVHAAGGVASMLYPPSPRLAGIVGGQGAAGAAAAAAGDFGGQYVRGNGNGGMAPPSPRFSR